MVSKVYGPYTRKDGRQHVIHYSSATGKRRTQSYPRYLMENFLGRELAEGEHVDHVNEDYTDNRLENLQILSQKENNLKHIEVKGKEAKMHQFNCQVCGVKASKPLSKVQGNWNRGSSGPYCSKRCAGMAE